MITQENDTIKLVFGYGSLLFGALLHKPDKFIIFQEIEKGEIGLISETKRTIPKGWEGKFEEFDENGKYILLPFNCINQVNRLIYMLRGLTFNYENLVREVNLNVIINNQAHKVDLQFNGPTGVAHFLEILELLKEDFEFDINDE